MPWRPTSRATCRSSCWPSSCPSRCWPGRSPSIASRRSIMALTLPLIPVFMWLIGRSTERRTRANWQALARLSNHFLDVMRGLPTLRAFNRGEAQAGRIAAVGDEYRRTTMQTLRLAFLSGAVLDLAATLATALVAVTLGLRLVDGAVSLRAAADRAAPHARALCAAARPGPAVPRERRRRGRGRAHPHLIEEPGGRAAGAAQPRQPGAACASSTSPWPTPVARGRCSTTSSLELRRGELVALVGAQRDRQDHRGRPASRPAPA